MPTSLSLMVPLNHSKLRFKVKSSVFCLLTIIRLWGASNEITITIHQVVEAKNVFVLDATTTYDILLGDSLRRLCWRYPSECMQTSSHVARGLYIL